jgi:hypothetical protein
LAAYVGAQLAEVNSDLLTDLAELGLRLGIWYQLADDLQDEVMSELERRALLEESRNCWRECVDCFHSLRPRLQDPLPIESWMNEFHTAVVETTAP